MLSRDARAPRHGCSWEDAEFLCAKVVSDTTVRARRDEWVRSGIFDALSNEAIEGYDRIVGLDFAHRARIAPADRPQRGAGTSVSRRRLAAPRRPRVVGHHSAQISVETCATARWIASRPATERFEPASRRERRVRRSTRAIIDRPDSSRVCAPGAREMSEDAARRARRVPADLEIGDAGARSRSRFGRPHDPAGRSSRGVRRWSKRRFHGTGRRLVISAWGGGAPGGTVLSNGAARRHAPDRGLAIMGPFLDVGSARPGMVVARAPWNQPTSVWAGRAVARRFPEYCGRVFGPLRRFDRPPMVFHRRVAVQRSPSSAAATQGPDSSG